MLTNHKGKVIIFEGVDNSGKSTLIQQLVNDEKWKDLNLEVVEALGSTRLSAAMGDLIRNHPEEFEGSGVDDLSQIMDVVNRLTYYRVVDPALKNGKTVLMDRSWISTFIYNRGYLNAIWLKEVLKLKSWYEVLERMKISSKHNEHYVYVKCNRETLMKRWGLREQDEADKKALLRLDSLIELYETFFSLVPDELKTVIDTSE